MKENKFFVRFKTDDELVIRQSIANAGAIIDFISDFDSSVAVITVLIDKEVVVLGRLNNDPMVESIFDDIDHETFLGL